jgi:hypothetical protein
LVKPIGNIYSQGFYRNLFHIFLSFNLFSMNSRRLYEFLELFNLEKKFKKGETGMGRKSSQGCEGAAWPSGQGGLTGSCRGHGVGAVTTPGRAHGSMVARSLVAHRRPRQREVNGRSTYIEWPTHQARWGGWVLTEAAIQNSMVAVLRWSSSAATGS